MCQLRRASRGVSKFYDDALMAVGLNVAQYSLLKHLQRLDRPCITGLAAAVGLDRSTLGRNLRVLEGKRLVALAGGEDQRSRLVCLTPRGKGWQARAPSAREQAQERLVQRFGP